MFHGNPPNKHGKDIKGFNIHYFQTAYIYMSFENFVQN